MIIFRKWFDPAFVRRQSTIRYTDTERMAKTGKGEKYNQMLGRPQRCAELANVNYCIPGVMSRCSAGALWDDQKKCKYARKSSVRHRCMYYIESIGGHCDCAEAQRELRKSVDKRED